MILDNADIMFVGLTKKERLKSVLSQFVEENNLSGLYSTILNNNELKNLLDNSYDKVLDIYKNSSDGQKNIITETKRK